MREFTSGITDDGFFIISMEDYSEKEISAAWNFSKGWHGVNNGAEINTDNYEDKYITVKWEGDRFYPTFHDTKTRGSKLVRIFEIKDFRRYKF